MSFWDSLKKTLTCNDGIILNKTIGKKRYSGKCEICIMSEKGQRLYTRKLLFALTLTSLGFF